MYSCPECHEVYAEQGFCGLDGAELCRFDDPLIGTSLGPYRVVSLLGTGGMGRVYRATNPKIDSRVAIKVLSHECAERPELVERFFAEARAANVIRHENIVNVIDLSRLADGRPYIVMEHLDGEPLSDVIRRYGRLPAGSFATLLCQVLAALQAAHDRGVVHRDLKPDNIFVSPQGRPKILDFGIAKLKPEHAETAGRTRDGSLLGTPHYMSPEAARGEPVDLRSDLYAMGVIVYEGLVGRPPFVEPSLFELLKAHIEKAPPRVSEARPDLPRALTDVVERALAKDRESRHESASELAAALSDAVSGTPAEEWRPIVAMRPSGTLPTASPMPATGRPRDRSKSEPASKGAGRTWAIVAMVATLIVGAAVAATILFTGSGSPVVAGDSVPASDAASDSASDAASSAASGPGPFDAGELVAERPLEPLREAGPTPGPAPTDTRRGGREKNVTRDAPPAPATTIDTDSFSMHPIGAGAGAFRPFDRLPWAKKQVESRLGPVRLVRVYFQALSTRGTIDVRSSGPGMALYVFRTVKSPGDGETTIPGGVAGDCQMHLLLSRGQLMIASQAQHGCEGGVRLPKCDLAGLRPALEESGVKGGSAFNVAYQAQGTTPIWYLTGDGVEPRAVPDDCR